MNKPDPTMPDHSQTHKSVAIALAITKKWKKKLEEQEKILRKKSNRKQKLNKINQNDWC